MAHALTVGTRELVVIGGHVGIGTTNPVGLLDVQASSGGGGYGWCLRSIEPKPYVFFRADHVGTQGQALPRVGRHAQFAKGRNGREVPVPVPNRKVLPDG